MCGSYSDSSVLSNHHSNVGNKNKLYRLRTNKLKLAYIPWGKIVKIKSNLFCFQQYIKMWKPFWNVYLPLWIKGTSALTSGFAQAHWSLVLMDIRRIMHENLCIIFCTFSYELRVRAAWPHECSWKTESANSGPKPNLKQGQPANMT